MPYEPTGPVVVGVDGSPVSLWALDLAAEEAVARVAPLMIVYAQPSVTAPADAPSFGRRLLAEAGSRAGSEHPCLGAGTELADGYPADVLVARAAQACLVVVGHRGAGGGRGRPSGPSIGSVAWSVVERASAPVLVYRPLDAGYAVLPRPVVVGVDALEPAEAVVEFAFAEAAMRGAPLLAVHVLAGADRSAVGAGGLLSEALVRWADKYPEVRVTRQVHEGADVAGALRDVSHTAQLIIVGASGRAGTPRSAPGLIDHQLVEHAGCPVAVVPRA